MSGDRQTARLRLGASTTLWAGPAGVTFADGGWAALSGAASVDYNVVLCTSGGDALETAVDRILEARVPAVLMVTGSALGEVQRLVARSWVCIGATPLMSLELADQRPGPDDPRARRLAPPELDDARALVADVFEVTPELARVAIPDVAGAALHAVWGAYDEHDILRSCLAAVRVQESVAVWSMATDRAAQGQGHGRRALTAMLAQAAVDGVERSILYASPMGEPFYRRLGYAVEERWQMWSRPRWVLGRA